MSKIHEVIIKESTEIEKEASVAAYAHFLAGRRWEKVHMMLGLPSAILAGGAGFTAFTNMPSYITGGVAMFAATLSAANTYLTPGDRAISHSTANVLFSEIRRKANLLRDVDAPLTKENDDEAVKQLADRLRELAAKMTEVDQNSPAVTATAKQKAEDKFAGASSVKFPVPQPQG